MQSHHSGKETPHRTAKHVPEQPRLRQNEPYSRVLLWILLRQLLANPLEIARRLRLRHTWLQTPHNPCIVIPAPFERVISSISASL